MKPQALKTLVALISCPHKSPNCSSAGQNCLVFYHYQLYNLTRTEHTTSNGIFSNNPRTEHTILPACDSGLFLENQNHIYAEGGTKKRHLVNTWTLFDNVNETIYLFLIDFALRRSQLNFGQTRNYYSLMIFNFKRF